MSKLNLKERIDYNFEVRELNRRSFENLLKDNSDEIKELFKPFEDITANVNIEDLKIIIFDKFGIIGELNYKQISEEKVSPSDVLLDFIANTYLKITWCENK